MTRKELLMKAINFEEVPRVPVSTLSGATWAVKQENMSPEELLRLPDAGAQIILDTCDKLNVDIVYGGRAIPHIILRAMGGKINNSRVGLPGEVIENPFEELEEIHNWTVEQVMENLRKDEEYQLLLKQTRIIAEKNGGERFVGVGSFGPFTTAAQLAGVNEFMMYLGDEDEEELVKEVLEFAEEVVYHLTLDFLEAGGDLVYIAEPVSSGDLISEEYFEKYSLPYLKHLNDRLAKTCPYMLLHICGKTMERISALKDSGIAIFSVDSLNLEEALRLAERKITIMGTLSPVRVLEKESAGEIYNKSRDLVKTAGLTGGFILAPGCDLTPDTPYEHIEAMVRAVSGKE